MCAAMRSRLTHIAFTALLVVQVNAFTSSQLSKRTRINLPIYQHPHICKSLVSDEEADLLLDDFYEDNDQSISKKEQQPIRRFKRPKKVPLIAVVGRPNVGKSALVNRIAGTQSGGAIVADEEGITRDRTYRTAEFLGETFQIVDTGGLVFDDNDAIFAAEIREQAMIAIEESSGVILVVDGQMGPTAMDEQLATFLRKEVLKKQPVLLAVNKCESDKNGAYLASQFWNMGLGEPFAVSALHGVGTADLLEKMFEDIVDKGSAIKGFGTKVKEMQAAQQAMLALDKGKPLDGEDETDVFLRKYGIGRSSDDVIKRYEEAMAAFDDEPTTVRTT
jgi:small GTP-binding protein